MKTKFAFAVLACASLILTGCGSSPGDQLVGKWEAGGAGGKVTVEFARDGQARLGMFNKTLKGTYKVHSGDELEWTVNGKTTRCKMKLSATELQLTSEENTIVYRRV